MELHCCLAETMPQMAVLGKRDLLLPDKEMEFCETPHTLCSGYQTDMHSVSRHGYQLEMGSDVDTETEGAASPDHALRMWIRGMKSEHSSCLSSRANSALSLTDTDHERKSDGENGFKFSPVCCDMEAQAGPTQGKLQTYSSLLHPEDTLTSTILLYSFYSFIIPISPYYQQRSEQKIKTESIFL
nr:teneurin-1-like [Vulpes vulpes]